MRHFKERFEVILNVRSTLSERAPVTVDEPWPLSYRGAPPTTAAAIAAFNSREQRLFDAFRRHGPTLDAWLARDALEMCLCCGFDDDCTEGEAPFEQLITAVPDEHRAAVQAFLSVPDTEPMPHFPVYFAPTAEVVDARLVPHGPPSRLEGLAPVPFVAWNYVVMTVEAETRNLDDQQVAVSWERLPEELQSLCGTRSRYADHLRAMNEAAIQNDAVRQNLIRERVMSACSAGRDSLIDPDALNRMLRDRIATLPKDDRAFYAGYEDSDDETDNLALYDVTFGITRATRSDVDSYEVRALRS